MAYSPRLGDWREVPDQGYERWRLEEAMEHGWRVAWRPIEWSEDGYVTLDVRIVAQYTVSRPHTEDVGPQSLPPHLRQCEPVLMSEEPVVEATGAAGADEVFYDHVYSDNEHGNQLNKPSTVQGLGQRPVGAGESGWDWRSARNKNALPEVGPSSSRVRPLEERCPVERVVRRRVRPNGPRWNERGPWE